MIDFKIKLPCRILVIDDDPDFLAQMKMQLGDNGIDVITADSSAEAGRLLAEETFDMAIVDIMMEEEDSGFALCYQIKKHNPDMPVIIATSVASKTGIVFDAITAEERKWIKADVILDKPFREEQLLREIERLRR
ncbi:MAG TPA: response regulator [Phycisphaerae bacterium]|nr:response regulator [Phycisphaerae bacterium]HPS53559.1 response regulator [Phycisphaerae bacterium]